MDILQRMQQLESGTAYRQLPPVDTPSYVHESGRRPILISAPHATCHTRNGVKKMEEEYTLGVARTLAQITNCHAIFNRWEIDEDPNWDQESNYKQALRQIVLENDIQFVIDIHGMTNRHQIGVAVGTMNGRSCPDQEPILEQAFVESGFLSINPQNLDNLPSLPKPSWQRLVMNHPRFTGGIKSHTITRFVVDELKIPAAQVEITSAARIPYRGAHDGWPFHYFGEAEAIKATMQALADFVRILDF